MPSVFEIITNRVLTALEQGEIPWHRPWVTVNSGAFNRVTGKKYSLLNQMMLAHGDGEYASYSQWTKLGGSIRTDEKPEIVVFWKWPEEKEDAEENTQDTKPKGPVLRYYRVYHISQVEGVEPLDRKIRVYNHDPIEQAENLMHGYLAREGIRLENAMSNEAFYSPARDVIHIPNIMQYEFVESIHKYFKVGTLRWMSFPRTDVVESVKRIACDDFFDAIEISKCKDDEEREAVRKLLSISHMTVCYAAQPTLLGGKLNPNAVDEADRQKAEDALIDAVDQAEYLGAAGMAFLAGKWSEETKEENYQQLLKTTVKI